MRTVKSKDIANSYDQVANSYEKYFLSIMHRHNDRVLDRFVELHLNLVHSKTKDFLGQDFRILDLACGTGYNTNYLIRKEIHASYTLVDLSSKMLQRARTTIEADSFNKVQFVCEDMLDFLMKQKDETYDVIVCMWALKYHEPHKMVRECKRILKRNGKLIVILNLKGTLKQMRQLYKRLIWKHLFNIRKIMMDLPNPKTSRVFEKWFTRENMKTLYLGQAAQKFRFKRVENLVRFIVSTGAMAGYDQMIPLREPLVQKEMLEYFDNKKVCELEHQFVYGIFEKGNYEE